MKRLSIFLTLLIIVSLTFGQKTKLMLNSDLEGFKLIQNDRNGFGVQVGLKVLKFSTEQTKAGQFVSLNVPSLYKSYDAGNPDLPIFSKLFEIPQDAEIEVNVISYDEQIIKLNKQGIKDKIMPAQPSLSKSIDPEDAPFYYNKETYQRNEFYLKDNKIAEFTISGTMRAERYGRLEIHPFAYNPVSNELKVFNNIVVQVKYKNANWNKTFAIKRKYSNPYFPGGTFANSNIFKINEKELITNLPITFVIITDPMFVDSLQRFVEWKKLMGYNVIVASTADIGTTTTDIKNYLADLYNNPPEGVNPPSFVLFVGDVAQIPTYDGTTGSHPSDMYYCDFTGDNRPDMYYGRWSAENANEINAILTKTLHYEKFYTMQDPSYLHETFLVAGDDESHEDTWGNGQINYGTTYYFNPDHNIYSHTFLQDPPNGNDAVHDSILADISSGVSFANYTAHCSENGWASPSFSISDLSSLTNAGKYGVWIGNCCLSNHFNYSSDAFGEVALYIANKGAVGYIGGSNSTYWDEDYYWGVGNGDIVANPTYDQTGRGAYDGIFHDQANEVNDISTWYITSSQIIRAGNLAVEESGSNHTLYYWEIYHLMGDPTLIPWIGTPQPLSLTEPPYIIGSTELSFSGTAHTYIVLTQDNQLIGVGITDSNGETTISLSQPLSGSELHIVAYAQFHELIDKTVNPFSPDSPYLGVTAYSPSSADYNTTVSLSIAVKNFSNTGSSSNTAVLRIQDPYISLIDTTEDLGDFNGLDSIGFTNAFSFAVAANVPNNYVAKFNVIISNGTDSWITPVRITLNAPILAFAGCPHINDSPSGIEFTSVPITSVDAGGQYTYNVVVSTTNGNGNGYLDPGEVASLTFSIQNNGNAPAYNTNVDIISIEPNVMTFNTNSLTAGTVLPGENKDITFIGTVSQDAPAGSTVTIKLVFYNDLFADTIECTQAIGLIIDGFEDEDFASYWNNSGNLPWIISTENPYEGQQCAAVQDALDDSQSSELNVQLNNVYAGAQLRFYYKVSSEYEWDLLKFYVNNQEIESWSGEVDWTEYVYTFQNDGDYSIKWEYVKDGTISSGADKAWLDFIIFPVAPANAKSDKNITISAEKLPDWLTLSDNGDGTATLTGTAPNTYSIDSVKLVATSDNYTATQEFTITVGVSDVYTNQTHVQFYPNPTKDYLIIKFGNYSVKNGKLTINDMSGKTLYNATINGNQITVNLSDLTEGIYLINLKFENNTIENKLIIQ